VKTKDRRQSKNVEEDESYKKRGKFDKSNGRPYSGVTRKEGILQTMGRGLKSEHLKDKTPLRNQKPTVTDAILGEMTNARIEDSNRSLRTMKETAKPTKIQVTPGKWEKQDRLQGNKKVKNTKTVSKGEMQYGKYK
jgi:hypothetical protein